MEHGLRGLKKIDEGQRHRERNRSSEPLISMIK